MLAPFFKAIIDADEAPVVVCDTAHTVVYMNAAAKQRYHVDITGKSIMDCHGDASREQIKKVVDWFSADVENNKVYTSRNDKENKDVYMIALRDENGRLIGYYEKHEYRNQETAELYAPCIVSL